MTASRGGSNELTCSHHKVLLFPAGIVVPPSLRFLIRLYSAANDARYLKPSKPSAQGGMSQVALCGCPCACTATALQDCVTGLHEPVFVCAV